MSADKDRGRIEQGPRTISKLSEPRRGMKRAPFLLRLVQSTEHRPTGTGDGGETERERKKPLSGLEKRVIRSRHTCYSTSLSLSCVFSSSLRFVTLARVTVSFFPDRSSPVPDDRVDAGRRSPSRGPRGAVRPAAPPRSDSRKRSDTRFVIITGVRSIIIARITATRGDKRKY